MVTGGKVIVFDMDGVLVEVGESYRAAIQATVEYFTGKKVTRDQIQDYKNAGGWNNDWALSQKISSDLGVEIAYDEVVSRFQKLFLGPAQDGSGGLIEREEWMPQGGMLERLRRSHMLAIFTGRVRAEMNITLRRFQTQELFDPTVCTGEIIHEKPAPDGLQRIQALCPDRELLYVGDTVDDARSSRAAGVPFIGIASPANPRRQALADLFAEQEAIAVLSHIDELEDAIAP